MPGSKKEAIVFGLIMSYTMTYGMELYNNAIQQGLQAAPGGLSNLGYGVFLHALKECLFMGVIVFAVSGLFGNRLGARIADRYWEKGMPLSLYQLLRQGGTIAVMCPTMSLIASILFSVILGGASPLQLPAIWVGTLLKNFPMAFFWNLFAAAPFTRKTTALLFHRT